MNTSCKFIMLSFMLFHFNLSASEGYLSCNQIKQGISWKLDISQIAQDLNAGSKVIVPGEITIIDPHLLKDTLYFEISMSFNSKQVVEFGLYNGRIILRQEARIGKKIDFELEYYFHGGTAGEFLIQNPRIFFIENKYASVQTCQLAEFNKSIFINNTNSIDMHPPVVTSVHIAKNQQQWILQLNMEDKTGVKDYRPKNNPNTHFTFKNLETEKTTDCYNKNLTVTSYGAAINLAEPIDDHIKIIVLPPGDYQLMGLNRQDMWDNFKYDLDTILTFKADESFYCL